MQNPADGHFYFHFEDGKEDVKLKPEVESYFLGGCLRKRAQELNEEALRENRGLFASEWRLRPPKGHSRKDVINIIKFVKLHHTQYGSGYKPFFPPVPVYHPDFDKLKSDINQPEHRWAMDFFGSFEKSADFESAWSCASKLSVKEFPQYCAQYFCTSQYSAMVDKEVREANEKEAKEESDNNKNKGFRTEKEARQYYARFYGSDGAGTSSDFTADRCNHCGR